MSRFSFAGLAVLSFLSSFLPGCTGQTHKVEPDKCNVVLILPASTAPSESSPERITKLTVDGKDIKVEPGEQQRLPLMLDPGQDKTVNIVYDYWPKGYSNTIRAKQVKLKKGEYIEVDFTVADAGKEDMIKPIYYPTPHSVVAEMCKMAAVGPMDVVYDIGCGDGRMVIAGVKDFGAKKGVGVELDPKLVKRCRDNAEKAGVADKVEFRNEDALKMKDLSDATVVLLYVGEDFGKALEPVLRKTLKPGARVVSHRFPLGDWMPDVDREITAKNNDGGDEDYTLKMWTIK